MFDLTATLLRMQLPPPPRRSRIAVMVAFATNGALLATLLARYAEIKEALHLDAGTFGFVVVGFTLGAVGAFHLPGVILRRLGSKWTTSLGTAWITLALIFAGIGVAGGSVWQFLAGLILAGFADAVVDVAQNAQGLRVQETYKRSLLSSLHAGWSAGAAIGGLTGTAVASLGVPLVIHLAAWGALCTAAIFWSSHYFLPDKTPEPVEKSSARPLGSRAIRTLAPLALVAFAGIAVEDIGNNWSAVLLSTTGEIPASAAGIALSILLGSQFVGRLLGDRFIDHVGTKVALCSSLSAVAVGLTIAAWAPWVPLMLMGFALAGLGCAITVPLAFAGANALPGLRPHAGVTWISWTMRAVTIALSPAIGGITTIASLPVAISVISLVALLALSMQLRTRR